jgi:hypothetical protein
MPSRAAASATLRSKAIACSTVHAASPEVRFHSPILPEAPLAPSHCLPLVETASVANINMPTTTLETKEINSFILKLVSQFAYIPVTAS